MRPDDLKKIPGFIRDILLILCCITWLFSSKENIIINTDTSQEDEEIKMLEDDNETKRRAIDSNTNYVNDASRTERDSLRELYNPK